MSKLEVKEIGPISGETDLTLGQSGGTVTLADGATAIGFGGGGKILQVVSDYFPLHAWVDVNGALIKTAVKVSITPSSSNSRVMLHMNSGSVRFSGDNALMTGIFRDDTILEGSGTYYSASTMTFGPHSFSWVDSPNTTSEVTYTIGVDSASGSIYWSYFNGNGKAIQLIAMEIGE